MVGEPMNNVLDWLDQLAVLYGGRRAIAVNGRHTTLTYAVLRDQVAGFRKTLRSNGVSPSDRVALVFGQEDWASYAVAYLAVQACGACAVLVPPSMREPERNAYLLDCRSTVTVEAHGTRTDESTWMKISFRVKEGESPSRDDDDVRENRLADLVRTSGTTGKPRIVAFSRAVLRMPATRRARAVQIMVHPFPPGTFVGTHRALIYGLGRGAEQVVLAHVTPTALLETLLRSRPSVALLTPFLAQGLLSCSTDKLARAGASLRLVTLSGAATPSHVFAALADLWPRAVIRNVYGLTEGGHSAVTATFDAREPTVLGKSTAGTAISVLDSVGAVLPAMTVGEIAVRHLGGPYWEEYDSVRGTSKTLTDWASTGDMGYVDANGVVYLVDRKKDIIIRAGENISAIEIEDVLRRHPDIDDAAVVGVPDQLTGERIVAVVVSAKDIEAREVRAFVRARLSAAKVPSAVVRTNELPRGPAGKVAKEVLRREWLQAAAPLTKADLNVAGAGTRLPPIHDQLGRTTADGN